MSHAFGGMLGYLSAAWCVAESRLFWIVSLSCSLGCLVHGCRPQAACLACPLLFCQPPPQRIDGRTPTFVTYIITDLKWLPPQAP